MVPQLSPTTSAGEGSQRHFSLKRERTDHTHDASDDMQADGSEFADEGHRDKLRITDARPICTSCEQCQIRKGKCDRGQPVCGWCLANDKVCEYKERKKPGLRAGYGRNLERRLDQVEEKLEAQARIIEMLTRNRNAPEVNTTIPSTNVPASASPATDNRSVPVPGSAPGPFGSQQRRPRAPSNPFNAQPGWTGSPRASLQGSNEYSETQPPATSQGFNPPTSHASEGRKRVATDPDLPPIDLLYNLVDLYFVHVNQWFPLLERQTTLERLFGSNGWEEADVVLLHAISCTTLRFSNDPRLNDSTRDEWYNRSKQRVLLYGMENSSFDSLQALVIVVLNYIGSHNGGAGLNLLALIARSAVQLGLAKEANSTPVLPSYTTNSTLGVSVLPPAQDWIEDESRRRLFWLIYVLDRDATVATSFDFAVQESDIDRKLPCKDELFMLNKPVETKWFQTGDRSGYSVNDPGTLGSLAYLVELKGLLTKIHHFLKEPVDIGALAEVEKWQHTYRELDASLRDWRLNLPQEFRNIDRVLNPAANARPVSPSWIMLQATYYTVSIRLHSAAAYPPHRSQNFSPSYSASQRCFQETESIISLAKYVIANRALLCYGPSFAFSLWVGARVLLVHGSSVERHVNPSVHFLIDTLKQLGNAWPIAGRYSAILARVMDDYQTNSTTNGSGNQGAGLSNGNNGASTGGSGGQGPATSTVPILADMRRCAYDLDMLISGAGRSRSAQPMSDGRSSLLGGGSGGLGGAGGLGFVGSVGGSRVADGQELEYLEAFDFFNYPRLPPAMAPLDAAGNPVSAGGRGGSMQPVSNGAQGHGRRYEPQEGYVNIDHFSVNRDADWLSQQLS